MSFLPALTPRPAPFYPHCLSCSAPPAPPPEHPVGSGFGLVIFQPHPKALRTDFCLYTKGSLLEGSGDGVGCWDGTWEVTCSRLWGSRMQLHWSGWQSGQRSLICPSSPAYLYLHLGQASPWACHPPGKGQQWQVPNSALSGPRPRSKLCPHLGDIGLRGGLQTLHPPHPTPPPLLWTLPSALQPPWQ